jgi:ABC-type cobalamin transport system permease subunit
MTNAFWPIFLFESRLMLILVADQIVWGLKGCMEALFSTSVNTNYRWMWVLGQYNTTHWNSRSWFRNYVAPKIYLIHWSECKGTDGGYEAVTGKKHAKKLAVQALKKQRVIDLPFLAWNSNSVYMHGCIWVLSFISDNHVMETRLKIIQSKLYRWCIFGK